MIAWTHSTRRKLVGYMKQKTMSWLKGAKKVNLQKWVAIIDMLRFSYLTHIRTIIVINAALTAQTGPHIRLFIISIVKLH